MLVLLILMMHHMVSIEVISLSACTDFVSSICVK